jgi:putative inorganic carbon (hco3(-)) transporter
MRVAAMTFTDRPVLGVGPGVAPELFQRYAGRLGDDVHQVALTGAAAGGAPDRAAHNMLLTELAELGIAGGAVFVTMIAVSLRDLLQARRRAARKCAGDLVAATTAITFALVAYLAAGLFLSLAFERYFWVLLGLAAAAVVIERREGRHGPDGHRRTPRPEYGRPRSGPLASMSMNPGDPQR